MNKRSLQIQKRKMKIGKLMNSQPIYLKFPGNLILNHALMKIRVVSGSHPIGPTGEILNRIQHAPFLNVLKRLKTNPQIFCVRI